MATANEGWGAPRIHGELLKLGIVISEREVSRLMPPRTPKQPSQTWRTFLDNHVGSLASVDFFTVPTATFRVLYVFFVSHTTDASFFVSTSPSIPARSGPPSRSSRHSLS